MKCSRAGESCIIVGLAPELDSADLTLLADVDTFVVNRFYRIYPEPAFTPTYYVCADRRVWRREGTDVQKREVTLLLGDVLFDKQCAAHGWVASRQGRVNDPLGTGPCLTPGKPWYGYRTIHKTGMLAFGTNPEKGFYQAGTVAYDCLQWAVYMGYAQIGILGVWLSWPKGADKWESRIPTHAGGIVGYDHQAFPLYSDYNRKYFHHAALVLKTCGTEVYNLSTKGHLDAFPRLDLETFTDRFAVREARG